MRRTTLLAALTVALFAPGRAPAQPDTADTRLLHSPTVSKDHVAFIYADDLWVCDLDGRAVLFSSWREARTFSDMQLFTVPAAGGFPDKLPIPRGNEASLSPDGSHIAYTPQRDPTGARKNYRGGTNSEIWVLRLSDL